MLENHGAINLFTHLNDLQHLKLGNEYYYYSMPLCILDAVFSIGVKYQCVRNVVDRYCKYFHLTDFRPRNKGLPTINEQHDITAFIKNIELHGFHELAYSIICNKQRTSPVGGILKIEAAYSWAKVFEKNRIQTFQDISPLGLGCHIENLIRNIPGQRSGISLDYFYMLTGNDDLCKPDRHIKKYLSQKLNLKSISDNEAQEILKKGVFALKQTYPDITVRLLDYAIWEYMSNNNKN